MANRARAVVDVPNLERAAAVEPYIKIPARRHRGAGAGTDRRAADVHRVAVVARAAAGGRGGLIRSWLKFAESEQQAACVCGETVSCLSVK